METDDISEKLQELLDYVREQYGFDAVFILEKVKWNNIFTYQYASVSRLKYDNRGVYLQLKAEDLPEYEKKWEAGIGMYPCFPAVLPIIL